jgi:undecaprenyl diphosphate synthase
MDGNGRWAKKRHLPRFAGHKRGVDAVRSCVRACVQRGVGFLTLFAFSSENWRRPPEEVSLLMKLFHTVLERDVDRLHEQGVRLKVVGDISAFDDRLHALITRGMQRTEHNTGLTLTIAANYGGRWDILNAMRSALAESPGMVDAPLQLTEEVLSRHLSMAYAPEPDLFIRTGGEQRISNFLLWQLAYTELYFTESFWPDFSPVALDKAIDSYQQRERRFGRTSEQVQKQETIPSYLTGEQTQC